ncbi:hypothetical protein M404DRAFT_995054 [Pisolithus tinctorius Marx 270]|uniref:Uncharacterized protein n=1 Tax=Pisolithus tinctorius Marx 270 TaxID=870435 RepID=A0A0C3PS12_PISTI|nr:hypothetical protein M404DRAFT_995054 [Pisolithus tinctorius Marx 270]
MLKRIGYSQVHNQPFPKGRGGSISPALDLWFDGDSVKELYVNRFAPEARDDPEEAEMRLVALAARRSSFARCRSAREMSYRGEELSGIADSDFTGGCDTSDSEVCEDVADGASEEGTSNVDDDCLVCLRLVLIPFCAE